MDELLGTVVGLHQVTKLTIACNWYGASTLGARNDVSLIVLPVLRALWKTCSSSIHSLTMRANRDVMYMAMRQCMTIRAKHLEDLAIQFQSRSPAAQHTARFQDIAAALYERFSSVRRMEVSAVSRVDMSFLFAALHTCGEFLKLERLCVTSPVHWGPTEFGRLSRFVVPNNGITSLHLYGGSLGLLWPEDLRALLDTLSYRLRDDVNSIRSVTLSFTYLTPDFVDVLAVKLTHISEVTLVVCVVAGVDPHRPDNVSGVSLIYSFSFLTLPSPTSNAHLRATIDFYWGFFPYFFVAYWCGCGDFISHRKDLKPEWLDDPTPIGR